MQKIGTKTIETINTMNTILDKKNQPKYIPFTDEEEDYIYNFPLNLASGLLRDFSDKECRRLGEILVAMTRDDSPLPY